MRRIGVYCAFLLEEVGEVLWCYLDIVAFHGCYFYFMLRTVRCLTYCFAFA